MLNPRSLIWDEGIYGARRVRELRDPFAEIGIRVAERCAVVETRDDLARAMVAQDVFEYPLNVQRDVHHRPTDRRRKIQAGVEGFHARLL